MVPHCPKWRTRFFFAIVASPSPLFPSQHVGSILQEVPQSSPPATMQAVKPVATALVKPSLLKHKDKEVRVFLAFCIAEVLRIFAPEPPYSDDVLRVSEGESERATCHPFLPGALGHAVASQRADHSAWCASLHPPFYHRPLLGFAIASLLVASRTGLQRFSTPFEHAIPTVHLCSALFFCSDPLGPMPPVTSPGRV